MGGKVEYFDYYINYFNNILKKEFTKSKFFFLY